MAKNNLGNDHSLVSPLEYRYGRAETKKIFSERERLRKMLLAEYAASKAESDFGVVPKFVSEQIMNAISNNLVPIEEIKKTEESINHDVMAMVLVLSRKIGEYGGFVHYGLTSNDINDTATALQLKDFVSMLLTSMLELQTTLSSLVTEHSSDIMLGRTHGQHASPITFGLKMAVFLSEFNRHTERVLQSLDRILVGKIMGPVGTGAFLGRDAQKIQDRAMEILGLGSETNPTQLVGRDRYIEFLSLLNNISISVERLATEIRNLQRPEIAEISEHFRTEKQVGSSSMPSKQNPVDSETVCSLSRLLRSFILPEYEASVYWHERDLTNSALERFTIPYASILCDFVVYKINKILTNIEVNANRMKSNLLSDPLSMSEALVKMFTDSGMSRQESHEVVRKISMNSRTSGEDFIDLVSRHAEEFNIDRESVRNALDPQNFVGITEDICKNTIQKSQSLMERVKEKVGDLKRTAI